MQHHVRERGQSVQFIIASGGNAGLAAACAAKALQVKCTIYLPEWVNESLLSVFAEEGAQVVVGGKIYADALQAAQQAVDSNADAVMVPAYDDKLVIEGHSSMVKEIFSQLDGKKPDAIVCSVGGAGLLGGVLSGCEQVGWDDVPVLAIETFGSNCFYHSVALNTSRDSWPSAELPPDFELATDAKTGLKLARQLRFSSAASGSLGASVPTGIAIERAQKRKGKVTCLSIPDAFAMQSLSRFADKHKMLVEMSCATAVAPAFKPSLLEELVPGAKSIVFIVCGGFKISLDEIAGYNTVVEKEMQVDVSHWEALCDGRAIRISKSE